MTMHDVDSISLENLEHQANAAIAARDLDTLEQMIGELTNNPWFRHTLQQVAAAEADLENLKKDYDAAGKATKRTGATEADFQYHYRLTQQVLEQTEAVDMLEIELAQYRRITARVVQAKAEVYYDQARDHGTFFQFTGERLGNLISRGDFVEGSDEWLQQRSTGIGGSDIGPILKVGDKKYQYDNYRAVLESKLNPTFEAPQIDPLLTATGRGHAWEDHLRQIFAERHKELKVWFTKDSYEHIDASWKKANFDGLLSAADDATDTIHGLWEAKTSSKPEDWGPSGSGAEGLPKTYLAQMLWYMSLANLQYGFLSVMINDIEYREYFFHIEEDYVQKMLRQILFVVPKFWQEVLEKKAAVNTPSVKAAFNWTPTGQQRGMRTLAEAADLQLHEIPHIPGIVENMQHAEDFTANLQTVLPSRERPFIVVDIETSSASPAYGRVLELSVVKLENLDEAPKKVFDQRFGMPDELLELGVKLSEVHRLTPDMLRGKGFFEEIAQQFDLMHLFASGTMVAHNKIFESRFFTGFLEDFGPAYRSGEITILDTMDLSKLAMPDTPDNRLETFAEYNGVPYVNAHASLPDTLMTAEALARFLRVVRDTGTWTPLRPTEEQRQAATEAAAAYVRN